MLLAARKNIQLFIFSTSQIFQFYHKYVTRNFVLCFVLWKNNMNALAHLSAIQWWFSNKGHAIIRLVVWRSYYCTIMHIIKRDLVLKYIKVRSHGVLYSVLYRLSEANWHLSCQIRCMTIYVCTAVKKKCNLYASNKRKKCW